jgi:hypothetical protein
VPVVRIVIGRTARSQFQILGLLVSVATVLPCQLATTQEIEATALVADLSIRPLDEDLGRSRSRLNRLDLIALSERPVPVPLKLTSSDRWAKFEVEFGIRETPATPIKYGLATAMYRLDVVLFALSSFAQDVGSVLHWKHSDEGWERADLAEYQRPPSAPKSLFGRLNESQFKVDFGTVSDKPYAALKWQIPFGN